MKKLEAINIILPLLGEHPVTTVSSRNPTVALILNALVEGSKTFNVLGWWFNKNRVNLYPDRFKHIYTPPNTLSIYTVSGEEAEVRGERLYNLTNTSYEFNSALVVDIVEDLDFELLPYAAANAVMYSAAIQVYSADYGVDKTVEQMTQKMQNAYEQVETENIRKRKRNSTGRTRSRYSWFLK